jgi:hypothetical protein
VLRFAILVCAALCLVGLLVEPAPARAGDALRLLSYNVHGLVWPFATDSADERIPLVAERMRSAEPGYDVVLLQENFHFRDLISGGENGRRDERWFEGNEAEFHPSHLLLGPLALVALPCWIGPRCEIPTTSGLSIGVLRNTLGAELIGAEPYGRCNGVFGHANDCFGSKGWLGVRLALASGARVDVYTTHLDAGYSEADRDVRSEQLGVLADVIARHSRGRAVIVTGDLNSRRLDPIDGVPVETFMERLGLEEAETPLLPCGGWSEDLDYILYRSGEDSALSLLASGEDVRFLDPEACGIDGQLSDHPATWASFDVDRLE